MSMTSREQFEQAIKARFGDSIDYRVCKNSDGEYMAWDMQVAWWAWQAASKASEQQLAAVVAENAGLKTAAVFATADDMWIEQADGMLDYRYVDWYVDVLKAAMETPATDSYLAEVRAQGVEMFANSMAQHLAVLKGNGDAAMTQIQVGTAERLALAFAAQLRQGAKS